VSALQAPRQDHVGALKSGPFQLQENIMESSSTGIGRSGQSTTRRRAAILGLAANAALAGCYVMPVSPEGHPYPPYPPYPPYAGAAPMPPLAAPAAAATLVLPARLYPSNERATQSGVLSGTITSTVPGKGRFQLNYRGETLSGEATRVGGDAKRGVASAYGGSGAFMSCEYQMMSPRQGAGTCSISDGAKYQVHVGN
jgi:hypothetical protein